MAAARQGRFREFHEQMFGLGRPTAALLQQAAQAAGVQPEADSAEMRAELARNTQMGRAIEAQGTPTFVVGDEVMHGAVGYRGAARGDRPDARGAEPHLALEALRDDIPFGRALAAGRGLGVLDGGEAALELGDQIVVGAAGEHLGDEGAAGPRAPRRRSPAPASTRPMVRR